MKYPIRRKICIVGDGPSAEILRDKPLPQSVYVIGVNHASVWLPRCNAYMTCFPDHRQRFLLNNQRQGVRYFAAVPPTYGSAFEKGELFGPREHNVTFLTRQDEWSDDGDRCIGGNSVLAALNLACHLSAEKIAIIGLDGDNRVRVSGGRPNLPDNLDAMFGQYGGSAEVVNGALHSTVTTFPRVSASEAVDWLL